MSDFMESADKLQREILAIRNEYEDILDAFKAAKEQKTQAKDRYNRCIDDGDEAGLKDCLRLIRVSNEKVASLPSLRESFYLKLGELEAQYQNLTGQARANVKESEDGLVRQKETVVAAKAKSEQVRGISHEINGLRNLVAGSGDVASSSEG